MASSELNKLVTFELVLALAVVVLVMLMLVLEWDAVLGDEALADVVTLELLLLLLVLLLLLFVLLLAPSKSLTSPVVLSQLAEIFN